MIGKYERLRAPFQTAMDLGCRRGEMFLLTWAEINFELRHVYFPEEITKTGEDRLTSLIEPAYSELLALKNQGVTEPTIFGISVFNASRLLRELFNKLIAEGLLTGYISGWHVCRHSQITRGFEAGRRPDVIRDESGHKTLNMTFYYAHAGDEDSLRDAQKLEELRKKRLNVSPKAQEAKNGQVNNTKSDEESAIYNDF
jgi:integrase